MLQMVVQARWVSDSSLLCLPYFEPYIARKLEVATKQTVECLPELIAYCQGNYEKLSRHLRQDLEESAIEEVFQVLERLPQLSVRVSLLNCQLSEDEDNRSNRPNMSRKIEVDLESHGRKIENWIRVQPDTDYTLCVQLSQRKSITSKAPLHRDNKPMPGKAYAPRYVKLKPFLLLY